MTQSGQLLKIVHRWSQPLGWDEPWPTDEERYTRVAIAHPLLDFGKLSVPRYSDGGAKDRAREQLRILDEMFAAGYRSSGWRSLERFGCRYGCLPDASWSDHHSFFRLGDDAVLFMQPYRGAALSGLGISVADYAAQFDLQGEMHERWPFYWPDGGVVCVELRAPLRRVKAATRAINSSRA